MTDQELLKDAAKAAGIEYIRVEDYGVITVLDEDGDPAWWWNPIVDDKDALRLAVRLDLSIQSDRGLGVVWVRDNHLRIETIEEQHNDDPYAATRRAIVRAAAKIGKELK